MEDTIEKNTEINVLDNVDELNAKKRELEAIYSEKTGYRIKIMSDEPYLEEAMKMYCGEEDTFNYEVPSIGEVVTARVLGENNAHVIFDAGFKDYVYVDKKGRELAAMQTLNLLPGQDIELMIKNVDETHFELIGSASAILQQRAAALLDDGINDDRIFMGTVKEFSAAGYFVSLDVDGVDTDVFMPKTLAGINKLPNPESIVGDTFEVMIENKTYEGYIVSRKKFLKTLIKDKIAELEHNKLYIGNVTGTTDFGIFVEFNECLTGMIHKANIDKETIPNISAVKPGESIQFYVKEIIKDKVRGDKIILTQVLKETLWDTIKIGDKLTGTVKSSKVFGTLLQLDEGTVGLIHISEIEKAGNLPLEFGDELKVEVISVQRGERKIFLTLQNE